MTRLLRAELCSNCFCFFFTVKVSVRCRHPHSFCCSWYFGWCFAYWSATSSRPTPSDASQMQPALPSLRALRRDVPHVPAHPHLDTADTTSTPTLSSSDHLHRESPCEITSGALPTSWVNTHRHLHHPKQPCFWDTSRCSKGVFSAILSIYHNRHRSR